MFNKKVRKSPEVIVNHQGGEGFKLSPKAELISILMTGFSGAKYYETLIERGERLFNLIQQIAVSPKEVEFVAKALVYARSIVGQRSVTHVGAVALAPMLSGDPLGKRFFKKRNRKGMTGGIVHRLDDMLEIAALYFYVNADKPLPSSIKKGFRSALENADTYELAKYQGKGKQVSLVDIVNLVHPRPDDDMIDVFEKLMEGELKQFNTVEDKNTEAGQVVAAKVLSGELSEAEAEVQVTEAKKENFAELISNRSIGYMALIRNIRNIIKAGLSKETEAELIDMLTDAKLIKQSLIFPHQIDIAMEIMIAERIDVPIGVLKAINDAYELAIPNLAELFPDGRTAVVVDTSGSMYGAYHQDGVTIGKIRTNKSPIEKAALIGATLAKGIGADLFQFATTTEGISYNPLDTVHTIKGAVLDNMGKVGHGTNFGSIFKTLGATGVNYDRIFVISDLQGANKFVKTADYKKYAGGDTVPYIYSVDIQGYGSTSFKPGKRIISLYGYSSDIYEMAKKVELDPQAVIKEINNIVI